MTFLDHLEELRWHMIRSFASIFILAVVAFLSKDIVFHQIILGPSRTDFWTYQTLCKIGTWLNSDVLCIDSLPFEIQSRQMTGQFTMHITSSLVVGLILAFPYAFWEFWRFISPALYTKERNASRGAVFFVSILFIAGVLFGYYIVSPLSINFLTNYTLDPSIKNQIDITSYISTLSMLVLSCAIMFQMPVVVYFLSQAGLVTPERMIYFRRHAFIVILVLSAILTPPDVMSQLLIALPLTILYQISIYVSRMVLKRKLKSEEIQKYQ
ncbi:twin-arginine translocase subunit TatC [Xanthovirga aplysinae]|uniref:twin-arginine translocase subunit TatC n=1 Tax=Xanthovirga aplysinae TaxID=2529853 RepID=UPI0012BBB9EC|nr:twin-arginine translocase subunit TatC [Xanthovirga aplysinae]MTI30569.1 twin-arginine translocase subunit TatC [Xanthovirga aplysinae]